MNKLLDELSQKAEDYADDTDLPWLATYTEKLTELIVKECTEQVWHTREDSINGNVSEVIKDRIKQRFGVR
jgi:hypothetical protein